MKEEEIKRIVQKSELETSADFTDRLMLQIEKNRNKKPAVFTVFLWILPVLCLLSAVISYLLFKNYGSTFLLSPLNLKISGTPVFVMVTVILLFAINYGLQLHENYKQLHENQKASI